MTTTPLQQAIDRVDELTEPDDWLVAATCYGLLVGYDARWCEEQAAIEVNEIEGTYTAPLTNIATGRDSRTYTIAGKLDKLATDPAGVVLFDHKTTSDDISDPSAPYWRQLAVDSQASHYELLLLANEIRVDSVVWDVVRKPGIKPKQVAAKDRNLVFNTGRYFGFEVSGYAIDGLRETGREDGELYGYRLAYECTANSERYFARRSNPRTRQQLAEYAEELWGTAGQIRQAAKNDQHFRNSGACFNYGTPCKFLALCSGSDTPESDNWQPKPKKHAELPDGIGGSSVLTNSRLRTFHTCRRKHYYEYELGIERVDSERREALYFGTVWHEALDAWWRAMDERVRNGDSNEQPVSSAGSQQSQTQLA